MISGKGKAPGKGVPPRALTQPQGCFVQKACISPSQGFRVPNQAVRRVSGALGPRRGSESWKGGDQDHRNMSRVWMPK